MTTRRVLTLAGLLAGALAIPGHGQDGPVPAEEPAPKLTLEQLPPAMRLGVRVELARQQLRVVRTLVIVPDARSYLAAVGSWSINARFPVLIDDGSWDARENIARFARGFSPTAVVRWSAPAALTLPPEAGARQAQIADAAARAWSAPNAAALNEHWATLGFVPPGAVIASTADPAWTGALALASARGQPIIWLEKPAGTGDVNGAMTLEVFDAWSASVAAALDQSGHSWQGLGEGIDAITLCLNMPGRTMVPAAAGGAAPKPNPRDLFKAVPGEPLATTDLLGRATTGDRTDRWAWCGQLLGTEAGAAYRAMSAIFLQTKEAWLFNGYESAAPWNQFAPGEGAGLLKKAGWKLRVSDAPKQGADDFRDWAAGGWANIGWNARKTSPSAEPLGRGGVHAGLITATTSGMSESFDLRPGQALACDVPFLDVPSVVYFVHSWSATAPGNRATIAGRWLERGAAAYVGSVHEPYLAAFVPPSGFVARMLAPSPLGAAARIEGSPPWRITVIGDPLTTLGPPAPTSEAQLPLADARDVQAELAEHLKTKDFATALWSLAFLGRDKDAARLASALLRDDPDAVSVQVALAAVGPAFRQTDQPLFAPLVERAVDDKGARPAVQDLVWHALAAAVPAVSERELTLLGRCLRNGNYKHDAERLAGILRKARGDAAAKNFLEDAARRAPSPGVREQMQVLLTGPKKP
ncbi:MAG: hypothetical protein ACKVS8_09925 [Phycisphaerales bacterium]